MIGARRIAATALFAFVQADAIAALEPGRYAIDVHTTLPHLEENLRYASVRKTQCHSAADIASGRAFALLEGDAYRACELRDVSLDADALAYRVECPGANAPSGVARFELGATHYRGTLHMQMGGKNMTVTHRVDARRIGDCKRTP